MTTALIDATPTIATSTLTALDRCDRCSAAALYIAQKTGSPGDLMFCGHHARGNMKALHEQGWTVHGDDAALAMAEGRRE